MTSSFKKNIVKTWGESGRTWLKKLSSLIDALSIAWNLTNLHPVNNLSYNYVLTGYQGTKPVVLKIGYNQAEIQKEIIALQAYNGNHSIQLLDSKLEHNAYLLEKAIPGTSLKSFYPDHDDAALAHAATIMQALHTASIPSQSNLLSLQDWLKDLYKPHEALNIYHIKKAQDTAQHLFATQPKSVLLHGDLHHDNILLSQRGWLAIDPKGIVGDPAFDAYAFIRNPNPKILKSKKLIAHRLELFAQHLSIDIQRLHGWIYVQAVLEACWAMNDGCLNPQRALAEADQIDTL